MKAQYIIRRVVDTLQDPTSVRWPLVELVRYLHDAQREVIMYRPDALLASGPTPLTLVAGSQQDLPSDGVKLIEIVRNATGNKRPIRQINREILDAQTPGWHSQTGVNEIIHYMFDPRFPKRFYVFPPANANVTVDAIYSKYPTEGSITTTAGASLPIDQSADNTSPTTVIGNIEVPDVYVNTLTDYVLYRAYAKDSEYAGNSARAQNHYVAFANALGIELKGTLNVAPTSSGNPNVAGAKQAA